MSANSSVFSRPSPVTLSEGLFFRSIDCHWLLRGTPLSAIGSRLRGGRYNRKGDFEAFYIADTQETALYETEAIFKAAGVVVGVRQPPRVMLSLDYDLQHVVDLREPPVLKSLDLTIDDLKQPVETRAGEEPSSANAANRICGACGRHRRVACAISSRRFRNDSGDFPGPPS